MSTQMTLTPKQCAALAKFAGWQRSVYGDDLTNNKGALMIVITPKSYTITPAGAFDLLRACEEQKLMIEVRSVFIDKVFDHYDVVIVSCDCGHLKKLRAQSITDLPTAIGLAVLQAIKEGV